MSGKSLKKNRNGVHRAHPPETLERFIRQLVAKSRYILLINMFTVV